MTQMTGRLSPTVDIRRHDERFKTRLSWLDSKHSFSFSRHYDPSNTHHGLLLVNNDDVVSPGTGFETHPHQDMEIVTWVLRGSLVRHRVRHGQTPQRNCDPDQEQVRRAARGPPPSGRHGVVARGAFPAPVRSSRHRHARASRVFDRRRRGAIHRDGRAAGHRHRTSRDPDMGDARHPQLIRMGANLPRGTRTTGSSHWHSGPEGGAP
jgi:hypothetical protein